MALTVPTPSVFLLISILQSRASCLSCDHCQTANLIKGRYLKGHMISSVGKEDLEGCVDLCLKHAHCFSINYHMIGRICDVSNRTRLSDPEDMVRDANSNYLANVVRPFNKCSDSLCSGSQVCTVQKGIHYSCKGKS